MCSDAPTPPDPNPGMIENAEAMKEIAKMQQDTSREYLDFAKDQYNQNKGFFTELANRQLQMSEEQAARSQEYADYERNTFRPMEQRMVKEAQDYNTESKRQQIADQAAADTRASFATAKTDTLNNLKRYGINPNSGRFAAINAQLGITEAAATAGNMTRARNQAETVGHAMKYDAVGLGRNLATNSATAAATSLNAGNSAGANRTAAGQQMGAAYGQSSGMMGAAVSSYGASTNAYGQDFNARMASHNAQAQAAESKNAGIGQLAGMAMMMSSEDVKENKKDVPEGKALKGLKKLRVEKWDYKPGVADEGKHIGPYAEEFKEEFGIGDGKTIKYQDAIGVTMKAVQDLSEKVDKLEKRGLKSAPKKLANGGHVRGKGGPVDDKIDAKLSNGEYVLPADTVKKVGVDALNRLVASTHTPAHIQRKQNGLKGKA